MDDTNYQLTPGEEKFEAWRRRIGFILGPAVLFGILLFPLPGLTPEQSRLSAVLLLAVIFWLTEAIPMAATSLLAPALCIPLGIAEQKVVLAPFSSPIIFLFMGSFFLAEAMRLHGLDRRIALWVLTRRGVTRSPFTLFAALGLLTAVMSMWMSNSATTAMMLPIALGVLGTCPGLGDKPAVRCNLVLLIGFAASVGGLGTPVGTPPNLISMGALKAQGVTVSFVDWMRVGVPLVIILTIFLLWWMRPRGVYFADRSAMQENLASQRCELGPVKRGEWNTGILFAAAAFLWMYPGMVELIFGQKIAGAAWLSRYFPEETVGLLCGLLLFLLPVNLKEWTFTICWREAVKIDWGTIFLFAGGLALGALITSTGLAGKMGEGIQAALGRPGLWALIAVGIAASILLSEAASNTASANVMTPLLLGVAKAGDLPLLPVGIAVGMACSFGFMLPVSTGPNAQAYGTGEVPLPKMIRAGVALDLAGAVTIFLIVWSLYG